MQLRILLPCQILVSEEQVVRVVAETSAGSFGILPNRLDCIAALVPGILLYEVSGNVRYLAIDEGILVKTGTEVTIAVRNAVTGAGLGTLKETVETMLLHQKETEKTEHFVIQKLESGFMQQMGKLKSNAR